MMDLRITRDRLRNHFHYSKWSYILVVGLMMVVWSFTFSATAPETPREYKVDIYILSYASGDLEGWERQILESLPPDQQEINFLTYSIADMSGGQTMEILGAWMAVQQGDIFVMPMGIYTSLAQSGAFLALDKPLEEGEPPFIETVPIPEDFDMETLRVEYEVYDEEGAASLSDGICGVPLDSAEGLLDIYVVPEGMIASVTTYSINQRNALSVIAWILENKQEATTLG
ncbi:MAG: hypothetical protein ACOX7W_00780 [Christensenellales bacterium]|jgi:hypothetical protein